MNITAETFHCIDCGDCTVEKQEYYMVKRSIWRDAVPEHKGMLCISCLETRMGRELNREDFLLVPVNLSARHSDLLMKRKGDFDAQYAGQIMDALNDKMLARAAKRKQQDARRRERTQR